MCVHEYLLDSVSMVWDRENTYYLYIFLKLYLAKKKKKKEKEVNYSILNVLKLNNFKWT